MGLPSSILFFFCNAIAPGRGGIERWCASIRCDFEKRGSEVFYLAAKPVWKEFADSARQFFLPNAKTFDCLENSEFFESLLKEKRIEVVLFLWADGKRFPFARVCRKLCVPVIAAIHTDPCFYEQRLRGSGILMSIKKWFRFRRQSKIYRWNARCCVATVLLSERFIPGFLKHFPVGTEPHVCSIPNPSTYEGVSVDFSEKKKEILFVGRMEMSVKQPQLLLQVWQKLQSQLPDWSLILVGGGHEEAQLRVYAETLKLERVSFKGFQDPEPFYRDASIFCMTSAYEGFPNVLVESASFGCVPVAFDSFAAVHDIVTDGKNGRLVPAFDVGKYSDALLSLTLDEGLRDRLARTVQDDSRRFSRAKIMDAWCRLFEFIAKIKLNN